MKEIYMAISTRIAEMVPEILWVDIDRGQNTGVEMPAALISMNYPQIEDVSSLEQQAELTIGVRLLFDESSSSETATVYPDQYREMMLGYLDITDAVAAALQGFGTPFMSPLSRRSQTPNLALKPIECSLQFASTIFEYFEGLE